MRRPSFTCALALGLALAATLSATACSGSATSESTPTSGQRVEGDASVTGKITYLSRIAMPPNARIEVTLENISTQDASSIVVGRQDISEPDNAPISFAVSYNSDSIDPEASYAIKATILKGEDPWMTNRQTVLVITKGNPTSGVQVVVEPIV